MKRGEGKYYNPDPLYRLIGRTNETPLEVDGHKIMGLIDSGANISSISKNFTEKLGLPFRHLDSLLEIEGSGGIEVPYLGYTEVNLKIPGVKAFDEDILVVIQNDSVYSARVPVVLGTLHIDMVIDQATPEELANLGKEWQSGTIGFKVKARQAALRGEGKPMIDRIDHEIKLSKNITLQPKQATKSTGMVKLPVLSKRLNVTTEPKENIGDIAGVNSVETYATVKTGTKRVAVALVNNTGDKVTIKKGTVVGRLKAANAVPICLAPKSSTDNDVLECVQKANRVGDVPENGKASIRTETLKPEKPAFTSERSDKLFSKLDLSGMGDWPDDIQHEAVELFKEYHHLFALSDLELGCTSSIKHEIKLNNEVPFKDRYRRIPPQQFEEVRNHLQDMLKIGAIRRSCSPWASAVVLVRKKDGSLRFCIDLRHLNSRTIKDAYSLPRIEESLDCLNGACIFTSLDLKSGYWQVEMAENSIPYTAFTVGPLGFYECVRMPFGLTNAPATFQRLMESCLGELHLQYCIIYLDDIIIFSKTPEEQLQRLRNVFEKLSESGLKLKPSKCDFFRKRLEYLGHIVSEHGIETNPKKIEVIQKWPIPTNITETRSFLGLCNYYRKFIKDYAKIAKPLYKLISGENSKKKNNEIEWTSHCQFAFDLLKKLCTEAPVLAYADYTKTFKVHTDASEDGLGAVLYQDQNDGTSRVIAYASRSLKKSEKKYHSSKLEFLALKWAITDRFHEYLYGGTFEVHTDNNPLTYVLTTAKLDATGQRWVASLANYNFTIQYRSGKQNIDADALSRIPWDIESTSDPILIKSALVRGKDGDTTIPMVPPDELILSKQMHINMEPKKSKTEWVKLQKEDPDIGPIVELLKLNKISQYTAKEADTSGMRVLLKYRQDLVLKDGLLYRKTKLKEHKMTIHQFVLPELFHKQVIMSCHDDFGHLGMEKTLGLLKDRFFWPKMSESVRLHIRQCQRCTQFKQPQEREEMRPIICTYPLELVHLDFLSIGKESSDKNINILVITDHYTRYAQAFVTPKQTAPYVAKTFWENFLVHYGWPDKIITDQGKNFESQLIKELCELAKVQKLRTTPYRPQTNGSCERFNGILISMLGTLPPHAKKTWPEWVSTLTHAYNCTMSQATGFSPFFLMFGRIPRIPIDVEFGVTLPDLSDTSRQNYAQKLKARLRWAYRKAHEVNLKESARHKRYYDRKFKCIKLEPGDTVLVRVKAFGADHKIADKWEQKPYLVVAQRKDQPVFEVKPVDSPEDTPVRVLHRNMLFPIRSVKIAENADESNSVIQKRLVLKKANELMETYFND